MPPLSPDGGWYDDRDSILYCDEFMKKARAAIEAVIPKSAAPKRRRDEEFGPGRTVFGPGGEPWGPGDSTSIRLTDAFSGIRALASGPPLRIPGVVPPAFRNAGDQFATYELRRIVGSLLKPTGDLDKPSEASKCAKLFDSPHGFRGFLDEAWKIFEGQNFSYRKDYAIAYRYGTAGRCYVTFEVPFNVVPLARSTIEDAAF